MHKRSGVVATAVILVLAFAGSASATHGGIHPTFKAERTYVHCVGANKLQNNDFPAPFDTTAPAGSFQGGAGCGFADPGALINTGPGGGQADLATRGTSVGNLKNMTVELYMLGNYNYGPVFGNVDLDVWLTIDGETYLDPATAWVIPPLVETNGGATQKVEFTITNLGKVTTFPDGNVATEGLATEDGDGVQEREILLTVGMHYGDAAAVWAFDATEVPTGITFNDPTPAGTKIAVEV